MVFRLPTPFNAIVSSPSTSRGNARPRPWRGTFLLHGINLFQPLEGQQRLFVASAETEGDNRTDLWPKQFDLNVTRPTCRLSDVQAWVTRNEVPLCMFMPDRHAAGGVGSPGSVANESHFRTLSTVMSENQLLCIAPWSAPGFPETRAGAGILILPNAASTGLLIGAIFLEAPFPDFIGLPSGGEEPNASAIPSGLPTSSEPLANFDLTLASLHTALPNSGMSGSVLGQGQVHGQGQGQGIGQNRFYDNPAVHLVHPFTMTSSVNASGSAAYSKPQSDGFSGDEALRAALVAAPFDWTIFDDTTDGSGSTSPGSTRTW